MHFSQLLALATLFESTFSYAHYSNKDFTDSLLAKRKGGKGAGTPGADGSQDPVLIGDLKTKIVSQTAQDIASVLLGDKRVKPESFDVKEKPVLDILDCDPTDTCCQWFFISEELSAKFLEADGSCNDLARAAIRLGFHDAGTWSQSEADKGNDFGGADGSLALFFEEGRAENGGLQEITDYARELYGRAEYDVGMGDLIQYMAIHATVTCPLGPRVRAYVGRQDATREALNNLLPDVHAPADDLLALFLDKTITAHDLAALLGAHSTSKQFGVDKTKVGFPQDSTPGVWDVSFYNETVSDMPEDCVFKFPSDVALAAHPQVNNEWMSFIDDQEHWNEDYATSYLRLSLLGVNVINDLTECSYTLPTKKTRVPPKSDVCKNPKPTLSSSSSSSVATSTSSSMSVSSSMSTTDSTYSSSATISASDMSTSSSYASTTVSASSDYSSSSSIYSDSTMSTPTASYSSSSYSDSTMSTPTASDSSSSSYSDTAAPTSTASDYSSTSVYSDSTISTSTASYSNSDVASSDYSTASTASYSDSTGSSYPTGSASYSGSVSYSAYGSSSSSSASAYPYGHSSSTGSVVYDPSATAYPYGHSSSTSCTKSSSTAGSYSHSSVVYDPSVSAYPYGHSSSTSCTKSSTAGSYYHSSAVYDPSASAYPYGHSSSTSCTKSSSTAGSYPHSSAVYDPSASAYPYGHSSSTSCTKSSSTAGAYAHSSAVYDPSASAYGYGHSSSTSTSCTKSKSSSSTSAVAYPTYSDPAGYHVHHHSASYSAAGYHHNHYSSAVAYNASVTTAAMGYPTVITTSYVDICSEGFTTVIVTYSTTLYASSTPSAYEVPEGWTTTVTVCSNCYATPATVTITKPIHAYETPSPTYSRQYAPAYSSAMPVEYPGSASPYDPSEVVSAYNPKHTSVTVVYETVVVQPVKSSLYTAPSGTAVAVSYSSGAPAPYGTGAPVAQGTGVSYDIGHASPSGYASGTAAAYKPSPTTSLPYQFTGAASPIKVEVLGGMIAAGVAVAAHLL